MGILEGIITLIAIFLLLFWNYIDQNQKNNYNLKKIELENEKERLKLQNKLLDYPLNSKEYIEIQKQLDSIEIDK